MYTLGTVFLEVVTSFDGVQKAARAAVRQATAGMNDNIDRDLAKGSDRLNQSAAKAGEQYGGAFEKSLRKRIAKMQSSVQLVGEDFLGADFEKYQKALKKLKKLDMSNGDNQDEALQSLRQMRAEINGVFKEYADGKREMRDGSLINLGALRKELGAAQRELERFRDPDVQTKHESDTQARALKAIKDEQDAWQRLGQSQIAARRMMDDDFNRRGRSEGVV